MKTNSDRSAVLSSDAKTNDLSLNHIEENKSLKQTFPSESTSPLLTSVALESSMEKYIQDNHQMYPKTNVSRSEPFSNFQLILKATGLVLLTVPLPLLNK